MNRGGEGTRRLLALAPHGVFAALLLATWARWILPFTDSPREVLTALRLSEGEVLYRDVTYSYGPLAPWLDALALTLFGKRLEILIALRVAVSVLGVEALRRLTRRMLDAAKGVLPEEAAAAAISSLVVATCFFQGSGGAYPFPYSVAALEGTVGVWWALELALGSQRRAQSLAAGLLAGLAAAMKLEFIAAGLGPLLFLLLRRPRREALQAAFVAGAIPAAAYAAPFAFLSVEHLEVYGPLMAAHVSEPWRRLYREVLWGGSAKDFFSGGFLDILWPSALCFGAVLFVARTASGLARPGARKVLAALFFSLGVLLAWRTPGADAFHALLPLGLGVFAVDLVSLLRSGAGRGEVAPGLERAAVGLAMLPAVIRQPFFFRVNVYAAFAAPLAMVVALSFLARRTRSAMLFTAFLAGLTLAQAGRRIEYFRGGPWTRVSFARGSLVLRDWDARLFSAIVSHVERTTPPGAFVAGIPEAGLVLFMSGRRSPFRDTQLHPGTQNEYAESALIRALETHDVRAAFVVDVPNAIWGTGGFGRGYLSRFQAEFDRRFVPVARLGVYNPAIPWGPGNSSAVVFRPRSAPEAGTSR